MDASLYTNGVWSPMYWTMIGLCPAADNNERHVNRQNALAVTAQALEGERELQGCSTKIKTTQTSEMSQSHEKTQGGVMRCMHVQQLFLPVRLTAWLKWLDISCVYTNFAEWDWHLIIPSKIVSKWNVVLPSPRRKNVAYLIAANPICISVQYRDT